MPLPKDAQDAVAIFLQQEADAAAARQRKRDQKAAGRRPGRGDGGNRLSRTASSADIVKAARAAGHDVTTGNGRHGLHVGGMPVPVHGGGRDVSPGVTRKLRKQLGL